MIVIRHPAARNDRKEVDTAMTETATTEKKELRRTILRQRRAMEPARVRELSQIICRRVEETDAYRNASSLCVYMPINNEVEADLLIPSAQEKGKRVYIPRVTGEEMIFNAYEPELIAERGAFHIRESDSEEILTPDEGTLVIMPGSVFDLQAHRIGYGGGYYDRYLSQHPVCSTIGVCFDFQITEQLPAEAHDISPQMVISELREIRRP